MEAYRSVVITGGKGMLAHELRSALLRRGVPSVPVDRDVCDITDPNQVRSLFSLHRPTLVLNCAAHTAVDQCEDEPEKANQINGEAAGILAKNCKESGCELIHFSTDFVFDGQSDRPYRPDDAPNPLSAYGRSKLLGEAQIQQVAPSAWIIIRTAWLFGRHGHCFPKVIVDRARGGHPLKVVCDQRGCPTYAVDLSEAVLDLVEHRAHGIWHLTNASPTNWHEFAQACVSEFHVNAEVMPITTEQWKQMRPKQAHRPLYSVLDIGPFERLTGKRMRCWRDALRDYRTEVEKGS